MVTMNPSTESSSSSPPFTVTRDSKTLDMQGLLNGPPATLNEDQVSVTARLLVNCRCHLGECVLYDDRQNCILFISILDRTFHKLQLATDKEEELQTYSLPKMVGSFGLLEGSEPSSSSSSSSSSLKGYIVAWEDGFQLYDLEKNEPLSPMSTGESVNPLGLPDRLNDGRVDPTGQFFIAGGCARNTDPLKVYKCEYDPVTKQLKHEPIVDSIRTTNSICWSLDGKVMYLADSPTKKIHQYDYDLNSGTVSNKRHFHDVPAGVADGSCVDSQGYVWNAVWRRGEGTGMVHRLDPETGNVVFTVYLPDATSEASCCCFGGTNLDILFVTTAWENLDPSTEVHAGGLYAVKLPQGITGRKEKRFRTD